MLHRKGLQKYQIILDVFKVFLISQKAILDLFISFHGTSAIPCAITVF